MPRPTSLRRAGALALLAVSSVALSSCSGGAQGPGPGAAPSGSATVSSSGPTVPSRSAALEGTETASAGSRPNILMITVDDAAPENLKHMPNVRRLIAGHGVNLTNGVAPTPICVPSRASMLTGQYAHNHGAHTISGPNGGFKAFEDDETVPVWLTRAGYDTMFIGKYLNGYGLTRDTARYVPPGWSDWRGTVGHSTYNYVRPTVNINGRLVRVKQYSSDLFSRYAVDLINEDRRTRRPWFLMLNYVAPHAGGPMEPDDPMATDPGASPQIGTPHVAARHRDAFADLALPRTPNLFEKDTSDKAEASSTDRTWSRLGRRHIREDNQQRTESLLAVDQGVGRAVRALRRTGQLANTVIMFSSDNGFLVGQHNRRTKLIHYEESLTVPMVLRGPGIPKGKRVATQVTTPDLGTTIAKLAGAQPRLPQDGVDIMPLLKQDRKDRVVPIQAWKVKDGSQRIYRGVRTHRWTYVRFVNGEEELFNHQSDPFQLENVANDPAHQATVLRMRALSQEANACAGATCPQPTQP